MTGEPDWPQVLTALGWALVLFAVLYFGAHVLVAVL